MKKLSLIIVLLAISGLWAIVNFGDDYIGSQEMGLWRKTNFESYYSPYGNDPSNSTSAYYYNDEIPTQLDSIHTFSSSGPYGGSSVSRFYYSSYPEYREVLEERWEQSFYDNSWILYGTINKRYNLQDQILREYVELSYQQSRTEYTYADGNLSMMQEYYPDYGYAAPYRVHYYTYDNQNRLIYTEMTQANQLGLSVWQTWSVHSQPDSIYIDQPLASGYKYVVRLNEFDENNELIHQKSFSKHALTDATWYRKDYLYSYIPVEGIRFPQEKIVRTGTVTSTTSDFIPNHEYITSYSYTNDYHNISYYDTEISAECSHYYNEQWLLESSFHSDDTGARGISQTWQYYGPISNNEELASPVQITAYPNPGREWIRIKQQTFGKPVGIDIFNLRGQLVRRLDPSTIDGDVCLYEWDCHDNNQIPVATGIYLIRSRSSNQCVSKTITVFR